MLTIFSSISTIYSAFILTQNINPMVTKMVIHNITTDEYCVLLILLGQNYNILDN